MQHLIKVFLQDGDEITTRINGTEDNVYNHYRQNNLLNQSNQVKKIEFLESPLLEECSSLKYLFIDYDGSGILQ